MAAIAILFLISLLTATSLPPPALACRTCTQPQKPRHHRSPPYPNPNPNPNPPLIEPPPPYEGGGGGLPGTSPPPAKCSLDILKLGLCLDALGGLVHVGLGNPAENICCPILEGLVEVEAATCLCTAIKLRVLNLDIYVPLALQLLLTCGKDPAPGYLCPLY